MRARLPTTNKNAEEDGNIDVERNFNINGNDDDFDSSGAMKKKKSVSSSSLPSMMMVPKNPWLLLVLGILFGAFLPTFMKHKSVRIVHKHVKGAYKAHSEASKEYLKRYRETYLEELPVIDEDFRVLGFEGKALNNINCTELNNINSPDSEKIYQDAIRARNLKLAETHAVLEFQKTPDIWFLYEPLWACPDIELVGYFHDGVKWVCGLRRMGETCIVYSFGSNGEDQFESDVMNKSSCKVFTFDPTMSPEKEKMLSPRVLKNFHNIGLGNHDGMMQIEGIERKVKDLKSIMRDLNHEHIDILKVDIEGAEYDVFDELFSSGFPDIRQILVEVHAFEHLQVLNKAGNVLQNPSELRLRLDKLFEVLEGAGFRLFHKEINVLWTHPMYSNMGVEYCFLRVIK
jgi:hypothetical protein